MLVGVRVGPGSPAVLLVVGRVRWVTGWPCPMAAPVAHRQRARVTGVGSTVDKWSASAPGCLCRIVLPFFGSCGRLCLAPWCVGLRVTLMEKCAQSTLQLPSELVVARGNWTLRSRAPCTWQFLFAVWVSSSWCNAWFNSGYMLCVSSWCFWKVFFVKVNSFPEVDSRPALLWPRSLEKCALFLLRVAWAASL